MRVIQKKICLLGDFAVGKTSLIRRYVEGRFDDRYLSTVGVKISRKSIDRGDYRLNLLVWDLAGGEEFEKISSRYLMGAAGALIVCDLTRSASLEKAGEYARDLLQMNPGSKIVLAGNKVDLVEEIAIGEESLQEAGEEIGAPVYLTSAKTGEKVDNAFLKLAELLERPL